MGCDATNVIMNPVNVYWRIEAEHEVTCVADSSDSLDGKYFTLMGTHYVWFNSSLGTAVDPAPAGLTAIEIAYDPNDSAAVIAGLVQAGIDAVADFSATIVDSIKVNVKAAAVGEKVDSADVDSGVSIAICKKGKNVDLGLLLGEPSPAHEFEKYDVTAHQHGTTKLGAIITGMNVSLEFELQETTKSKLAEFFKIYGGQYTPSGGTEIIGMGTAAIGKNILIEGARVECVAVNTISEELSYKYTMMLGVPVPGSLVFSSENPRTLTVTFDGYADLSKDSRNDVVVLGDSTQAGI